MLPPPSPIAQKYFLRQNIYSLKYSLQCNEHTLGNNTRILYRYTCITVMHSFYNEFISKKCLVVIGTNCDLAQSNI